MSIEWRRSRRGGEYLEISFHGHALNILTHRWVTPTGDHFETDLDNTPHETMDGAKRAVECALRKDLRRVLKEIGDE